MYFFCQWHLLLMIWYTVHREHRIDIRILVNDFRYVLNLNKFNSITDDQHTNHTYITYIDIATNERKKNVYFTRLNALKMS